MKCFTPPPLLGPRVNLHNSDVFFSPWDSEKPNIAKPITLDDHPRPPPRQLKGNKTQREQQQQQQDLLP